jgi:hypothetical protein
VFRLGPDQLDAAQGWVQCSVCGAAFDAHPSLLMEDGSPLPLPELPPEPEAVPAEAPAPEAPVEETRGEEPATVEPADAMAEPVPDVTPSVMPVGIAQREHTDDLPSIILIDPDAQVDDDPGPLPQFKVAGLYPSPPEKAATASPASAAAPAARVEYAPSLPSTARITSAPRRIKSWVWGVASTLLLLILVAQTAYFLRDTLVSRFPELRPGFERACALLGCTLSLPHDASLVRILGSDLQAEPGNANQLRLTLTLGNHAPHAQAWPVLVLTLTDRRDRPQARRSFAPSEYLSDPARVAAGMAAATEYPLTLTLTTRDLTLAGYRLELAY